ncbi:MAG TPA: UDP-N-acetylglucosamine 1-carboxyvinyltransferase [Firmicutes bacterium]|nr:UDP-N-acetylglucosamine 1-carboxyvinyltransferase [Bacillota bacterium]
MDKYRITGGKLLSGEISVSGSKNSALAVLPAAMLISGKVKINNVPRLKDVDFMLKVLESLGVKYSFSNNSVEIDSRYLNNHVAAYDLIRKMRASIYVLSPLLHRFKKAEVSLPGGCAIGIRPVDLHIKGLRELGVEVQIEHGYIEAKLSKMKGKEVYLDFPSVGATCQLIIAGTLAEGRTVIFNAAKEPEIEDLGNFLNKAGAKISGLGSDEIVIDGVDSLHETEYSIIPDRIESGSFTILGAALSENLVVKNVIPGHIESLIDKLQESGAVISQGKNTLQIKKAVKPSGINIKTLPYPGFPTDLQAPIMAYLSVAEGFSVIKETIFENRFHHIPELNRLGADINTEGEAAYIKGVEVLEGAQVMASDLRGGFCLVLAGLIAGSETIINRIYHIDRGYEDLETKLQNIGAAITRIE